MNNEKERRARGSGRIFKPKGCQYWYIRYYDIRAHATKGGRVTKLRTESTKSTKRSVAERMLRDRLARKDRGELIVDPRKLTFDDMEDMIKEDYQIKGRRSLSRLKTALVHLRETFAGDRALDITPDRFASYVVERQREGASNSSIMTERAALGRMFTLATRAGRLPNRPHLPTVEVHNVREVILEDEEVATLLADEKFPEEIRGAIEFGWYTGWRVLSEVLPLTWDQIDLDVGEVRWPEGTTKNKRGRVLAFDVDAEPGTLDAAIRDLLLRWHARARLYKGDRWVFHRKGRPVKKKRFYVEWHAACTRNEIRDLRSPNKGNHKMPHDLRRAAATRFIQAGLSEAEAMSFTGHETTSMLHRYSIIDPRRQRAALKRVAAPSKDPDQKEGQVVNAPNGDLV